MNPCSSDQESNTLALSYHFPPLFGFRRETEIPGESKGRGINWNCTVRMERGTIVL